MERESDGDGQRSLDSSDAPERPVEREVAVESSGELPANDKELRTLRDLLFGRERRQLQDLSRKVDTFEIGPDDIAEHLPDAIVRAQRDDRLARALSPAIADAARRDPQALASAIAPAIGPAVRQAAIGRVSAMFDPKRRDLARLWWILPILVLAALVAALAVRSNQRWSHAIERLEREPGIVLVRAERGWSGWRLAGLRDPLAADPAAILATVGADTSSISARWEPYVSMQPQLVLERARRTLGAPGTVTLELRGDMLVASGQASAGWIDRASTLATSLPGITRIDLSDVRPGSASALDSIRIAISETRILFGVGMSSLDSSSSRAVDSLAASLAALSATADADSLALTVELIGRTDSTGTEATNTELARWRAVAVREALVARGISASLLTIRAAGYSEPLTAADAARRERINRSVSVVPVLRARDAAPSSGDSATTDRS